MLVTPRLDLADRYLDRVEVELSLLAPSLPTELPAVQLHWGGGSPSYLTPPQMRRLKTLLDRHFCWAPEAELALEVDPRIASAEHVACLRELGFNRLSMGVQDFDDGVQRAINRIQSAELTAEIGRAHV